MSKRPRRNHSPAKLFGTAHVTRPGNIWQTPRLKAAITASKTIWREIAPPDDKSAIAALTQKLGIDRETPLDTRLTPQQNQMLATVAARHGLPPAQLMPMRPWLAGMMIARMPVLKTGFDQGAAARTWLTEREADLLPVGYFHIVFTLPAEVADIAWQNKAAVYVFLS